MFSSMHSDVEFVGWHDGSWVYPRVIQLLELPVYRHAILSGLLMSIGSRTESTVSFHPFRHRYELRCVNSNDQPQIVL